MQNIIYILISLLLSFTNIYINKRIVDKKTNIIINTLIIFLIGLILFLKHLFIDSLSDLIIIFILLFLYNYLVNKDSLFNIIIFTSYVLCLNIICKIIYYLLCYLLFKTIIYSNLYFIFLLVLANTKIVIITYKRIVNLSYKLYKNKFISLTIITFILSVVVFNSVYFKYKGILLYLIVIGILIIYFIFILIFIIFYTKYSKIVSRYSLSLDCLTEYEDLINKYRVSNHENRNQLLIIRNLGNYRLVKNYIDKLIDNQDKDSKTIDKLVKRIPSSHLKAIFYSKLTKMKNNNITFSLVVGRSISSKMFFNIDDNTILDMCNIVNIILDNAIESSLECDKKEILIDISKDDNLVISVSNNYKNNVDLSKIYDVGYSTKGKGHGYGLPLVRDIINKNKKISKETEINDKWFTQTIYINTL